MVLIYPATPFRLVKDGFHKSFGVKENAEPDPFPDLETMRLRWNLIVEEFIEVAGALGLNEDSLRDAIHSVGYPGSWALSLPLGPLVKELVDLEVVTVGTLAVLGVDGDEAFRAVHESNMSKLGEDGKPILREDGKVLKGPNYQPADMSSVLRAA